MQRTKAPSSVVYVYVCMYIQLREMKIINSHHGSRDATNIVENNKSIVETQWNDQTHELFVLTKEYSYQRPYRIENALANTWLIGSTNVCINCKLYAFLLGCNISN